LLADEETNQVCTYLRERFGVPQEEVSRRYCLLARKRTVWALSREVRDPADLATLKIVSAGIPFLRKVQRWWKPTTSCLRILSPWIRFNRVLLSRGEAWRLLREGRLSLTPDSQVSDGYVLVETPEGVLGCGLLLKGTLHNQIPKHEVQNTLRGMETQHSEPPDL
jgi:NOL1/NOP2/fmu family ribosome biogenesis protein